MKICSSMKLRYLHDRRGPGSRVAKTKRTPKVGHCTAALETAQLTEFMIAVSKQQYEAGHVVAATKIKEKKIGDKEKVSGDHARMRSKIPK